MTITGDVLLFFLGLMALVLMPMGRQNILFTAASSMIWFALFMWLFFSDTPPLSLEETWGQILTYVFFIMAIVPWLMRMDVEIRTEAKGKRSQTGQAWKDWGAKPKTHRPSEYEDYREKLYRRTRK